jgi:hypothetical protein
MVFLPFSLSFVYAELLPVFAHTHQDRQEKRQKGVSTTPDCAIGALSDRTKRRPEPKGAKGKREGNFQFFAMVTINSRQKEKNIINKIIFTYLSYIKCNHKKGGGDKMEIKKEFEKFGYFAIVFQRPVWPQRTKRTHDDEIRALREGVY